VRENLQIHGFLYDFLFFRLFWLIAVSISFFLTVLMVFKFVSHADKNPIVIYVEEKQARVADINFPAVSICPGLVLARESHVDLDYDGIIRDLEKGLKKIEDLSDLE
jgi:hypothetical protein